MKIKLFIALMGTCYLSILPMNKEKILSYVKAGGYSLATAFSAGLIIYSLYEIPNRPPIDTVTSIIAGVGAGDYFGGKAYRNIMQAWKGKNYKIDHIHMYMLEISKEATQKTMVLLKQLADSNYFDMSVDLTTQGGSEKIPATIRLKTIKAEEPTTQELVDYFKKNPTDIPESDKK